MAYNFALTVFTQRNFVADFLHAKCLRWKTVVLRFEPPLGGLGATYDVHLRLKARSGLPISVNKLNFFARCYG